MKCQRCSESEALHEIEDVLRYAKDRMARWKMNYPSNTQFTQINVY